LNRHGSSSDDEDSNEPSFRLQASRTMDRQMDDDGESPEHDSNKGKRGGDGSLGAISKTKTQKDAAINPTRASTKGKNGINKMIFRTPKLLISGI